jgi:hypothetical protein
MSGTILSFPYTPSWRAAQLKAQGQPYLLCYIMLCYILRSS